MTDKRELIDECFYVWPTRFGLWSTETTSGRKMLTALTREEAVKMTAWHLKCEQDGTLDQCTYVVGDNKRVVDL